ncbi:MAG TPA: FAD-dependent monooxygenase [Stellaceae bacterium]|nr:FAD-dependent monooxygenase [Stellaceae bacterium]
MTGRAPVLIAGGGPAGLLLAAELGWRGVACLLVEQDPPEARTKFSRIMQVGVRTMEFLRRLGAVERVKGWDFPRDFPFDNVFVTSLKGYEIARFEMYSLGAIKPNPWSPEHQWHCPQYVFDPILQELASSFPSVTLRHGCRLDSFEDRGDAVVATLVDVASGARETVEAGYLVGCDGFASTVRERLGIAMEGEYFIDRSLNIEFRTSDLSRHHDKGNAGRYICVGPEGTWSTTMAVDGRELWRILLYTKTEDVSGIDAAAIVRRLVGGDIDFTISAVVGWSRRALNAAKFRKGRVFLAGDAAHSHPPNGGFGMNTGAADAADLGWKLAAVLDGWAPPALLDSYEVERRPVCQRAIDEAMRELHRLRDETYPGIDAPTEEGARLRHALGEKLRRGFAGSRVWYRWGMHLGYIYEPSPIVVPDGTPLPPDDTYGYAPTARPGARAPHFLLPDGRSVLDLFGRGFVLLRFDRGTDAEGILAAARARRVPLDLHDVTDAAAGALYASRLALVRPDGHVAWRGDAAPRDAAAFIDRVRGAAIT